MAGLNPFAELGLNPNDPNLVRLPLSLTPSLLKQFFAQMQTMMSSPQFMQQMSSMLSNPGVLDQVIASNPQLQAMGPQLREAFQSPQFQEML